MHKGIDYCTYEMSAMLKDLGYKESSMWWYNTVVDYPEDGGEVEIIQLVKGNRWMNYESWEECPKDFIICPMLYDAHTFLCEELNWVPAPIKKHYYSDGDWYEFQMEGKDELFSASTFKKAFRAQIENAINYYWNLKFPSK